MGYELIIKKENSEITKDEWLRYIDSDIEFNLVHELHWAGENGKSITWKSPNTGLWKTNDGEIPFIFSEKYKVISVNKPEEWVIKKMISIANEINAIVVDED